MSSIDPSLPSKPPSPIGEVLQPLVPPNFYFEDDKPHSVLANGDPTVLGSHNIHAFMMLGWKRHESIFSASREDSTRAAEIHAAFWHNPLHNPNCRALPGGFGVQHSALNGCSSDRYRLTYITISARFNQKWTESKSIFINVNLGVLPSAVQVQYFPLLGPETTAGFGMGTFRWEGAIDGVRWAVDPRPSGAGPLECNIMDSFRYVPPYNILPVFVQTSDDLGHGTCFRFEGWFSIETIEFFAPYSRLLDGRLRDAIAAGHITDDHDTALRSEWAQISMVPIGQENIRRVGSWDPLLHLPDFQGLLTPQCGFWPPVSGVIPAPDSETELKTR